MPGCPEGSTPRRDPTFNRSTWKAFLAQCLDSMLLSARSAADPSAIQQPALRIEL